MAVIGDGETYPETLEKVMVLCKSEPFASPVNMVEPYSFQFVPSSIDHAPIG